MNIFIKLYQRNRKLFFTFIIISCIGIASFFANRERDPLAEYKKQVKVEFPAEAKNTLSTAIGHIEDHNMNALFKLMAHNNRLAFNENYTNGIFAERDFCPVKISDEQPVRFAKSKSDHLIVKLYSEKRKCFYLVSLKKVKGNYRIYSIMPDVARG